MIKFNDGKMKFRNDNVVRFDVEHNEFTIRTSLIGMTILIELWGDGEYNLSHAFCL